MSALLGVFGTGGHGRETMPALRTNAGPDDTLVFIDDAPTTEHLNGHRVLSWDQFLSLPASSRQVSIAIGDSAVRERIDLRCRAAGVGFLQVKASTAEVLDRVEIGEGAILSSFSLLTSDIMIGRHFHANTFCSVAHDCVIGDYVTFGPGVRCNGSVHVEDHAYIGSGAVIRQGRPGAPLVIGRGAIVGMGAIVTKSVPPGVTVVGNPARVQKKD